jgi:hypothetical protein
MRKMICRALDTLVDIGHFEKHVDGVFTYDLMQ